MPIGLDIEVTRNDCQSDASKKHKNRQVSGSRGNKPDLMVQAFFKQKWNKIAYVESGKWKSTDTKTHNDHNKLARFTSDGYTDLSKKTKKDKLYKFCIVFGINITEIHSLKSKLSLESVKIGSETDEKNIPNSTDISAANKPIINLIEMHPQISMGGIGAIPVADAVATSLCENRGRELSGRTGAYISELSSFEPKYYQSFQVDESIM
nr:1705_t:CDS:2 [Entrophospora candida]